mgnify:CR=1 FL=1
MATLVGNDGAVTLNSVAVAAVRNFSLDFTADTIENTTMGSDTRTYVRGPASFSGSIDVYFDPVNFNGNVHFNPTSGTVGQSNYSGTFYLKQDATDDIAFTVGNLIVTGYSIKSSYDGLVEATISVQGSGSPVFSQTGNV